MLRLAARTVMPLPVTCAPLMLVSPPLTITVGLPALPTWLWR